MHEILGNLAPGKRVLDLGARSGSFDADAYSNATVVRLDLSPPPDDSVVPIVQADAALLPFKNQCFDVVIANHSLEHMARLDTVLAEIGRVVRPAGSFYLAVPDSTTLSDRIYRWVYHGGGHINPFRSVEDLMERIRPHISLPFAGYRLLYSSFGYLEKRHFYPRPPRRMWLFSNGSYTAISIVGYMARLLDHCFHTRLSIYGWAIYYGHTRVNDDVWSNVCVWCGSAQPAQDLNPRPIVWLIKSYNCPACGAWNLFTRDPVGGYARMRTAI